ncbi:hypothetical protein HN803_01645 [candidate division WWE3 bacterium]|nr:hypothetical protein [candidate division WWE3 bacterium]MBT7349474.1 hypothetical protein [candidate division WWE3 bacterium]
MDKIKKFKYELYAFGFYVLSRLPSLGHDMFNTDVWKWKQRIYDFGTGVFTLNFEKTIHRYHPGVTLMWIGTWAVKVYNFSYRVFTGSNPPDNNIDALFNLHFTQKLFIVLFVALIVALIFHVLKKLFGLRYAGIALALIVFEPFYVALTRVVHLEGLQSTLMLSSFLTLYLYVSKSKNRKWLFVSALLGAWAVLTKTSAVFIFPFAAFLLFLYPLLSKNKPSEAFKYAISNLLVWFLMFCAVFFISWPAMWTHSGLVFETLKRGIVDVGIDGGHLQMFKGVWVEDPGPTFYWYVFILKSSLYLIGGVIGSLWLFKGLSSEKKKFAFFTLAYALLYAIEVSIPSKKLDRYLMPSMISLLLFAGLFFEWSVAKIAERYSKRFMKVAALLFLPAVLVLGALHPDYFSYFSPLGGGLKKGIWTIEPKWVIGQHALMDYLEEEMNENNLVSFENGEALNFSTTSLEDRMVVAFPEKYYTQLHPLVREIGGWATIESIRPDTKNALLGVFPVWFDDTKESDAWEFQEQVYLRGVPIYNVYKNTDRFGW